MVKHCSKVDDVYIYEVSNSCRVLPIQGATMLSVFQKTDEAS